jgi:hypothetical protein
MAPGGEYASKRAAEEDADEEVRCDQDAPYYRDAECYSNRNRLYTGSERALVRRAWFLKAALDQIVFVASKHECRI